MIISASRRTDIPAFHSEWFLNRINDGYAIVTHNTKSGIYYRVPLTPDVVDCIVFRTKNPTPILSRLNELQDYKYLFNITMNPYEREMEANVPSLQDRVENYKKLSDIIGSQRMIWRYDPVMLSLKYDMDFHRRAFEYLCRELSPYSYKCMIGFIIHHGFVARRIDTLAVQKRNIEDMMAIGNMFGQIASQYGHAIETCATEVDLDEYGIMHGACVERKQIEEIVGYRFDKVKEKYLRPHCNCMESIDIGHYSTCDNGCLYCYATPEKANMNVKLLCPSLEPGFDISKIPAGKIIDMECRSFRPSQMSLW
ncbi:MAG: DUF1848 domain-containing protein [Rikenellaceae bacterium]|nr:DUF1848 domain-containing protein [Rikenellaceae bacterium]